MADVAPAPGAPCAARLSGRDRVVEAAALSPSRLSGRDRVVLAVAARLGVLGAGALALSSVHVPRPAVLCPLRAMTGVPCPICGTTTALVRLGRLDVAGALLANPLTMLALAALALAPVTRWRPWASLPVLVVAAAIGEAWQLVRFDVF